MRSRQNQPFWFKTYFSFFFPCLFLLNRAMSYRVQVYGWLVCSCVACSLTLAFVHIAMDTRIQCYCRWCMSVCQCVHEIYSQMKHGRWLPPIHCRVSNHRAYNILTSHWNWAECLRLSLYHLFHFNCVFDSVWFRRINSKLIAIHHILIYFHAFIRNWAQEVWWLVLTTQHPNMNETHTAATYSPAWAAYNTHKTLNRLNRILGDCCTHTHPQQRLIIRTLRQ